MTINPRIDVLKEIFITDLQTTVNKRLELLEKTNCSILHIDYFPVVAHHNTRNQFFTVVIEWIDNSKVRAAKKT